MKKGSRLWQSIRDSLDVRRFPKKKRAHFFINLAIGFGIVILLHFLQETRWGEGTLDKFFDLFISSESRKAVQAQTDLQHAPILFVDIDHDTYAQWGEPLITPRDKLARILKVLYDNGAKVVVLDILLEGPDCRPENDRTLLEVIEKIRDDPTSPTKLILSQRIGFKGELKKTIFDRLLEKGSLAGGSGSQKIYRATPTLSATGSDNVVRYWSLYERFHGDDGREGIIWGSPIVAVLLAVEGGLQKLGPSEEILQRIEGNHGTSFDVLQLNNGRRLRLPYEQAHLYLQRLRFWLVPQGAPPNASIENESNIGGNLYQTVVKFDELEYYREMYKDKIVIVGNSSPDVGDIHRTPVGDMAGMYVLGNSIYTILEKEQPSPPPVWLSLMIEIVVIIGAAYIFLYFTSLLAQIIASVIILLVFGYFSYLFFMKTGVFVNFVFAIVGMGFHETAKDLEEIIEKKGVIKYSPSEKA
jgi:CHASE2 domain-containing sensor protein